MRKLLQGIVSLLLIVLCTPVFSQRPKIKFGNIKPEDFSPTVYKVDSSANGVILFDVGNSYYEGDNSGGFSVVFKRHTRIRLLNRNSFDLATISIPTYLYNGMEEKIESLEASTYVLENGKVETYKLDKSSIFKDKLNKYYVARKFTLPNLKEGCIIEINYTLKSPYERDLRSWYFQGEYPRLWSEYTTTVPAVYDYTLIGQGYRPFTISDTKQSEETYNILSPGGASERTEVYTFKSPTTTRVWAMENVPKLKEESFTTTLDNHVAKIDFQLSKISYPDQPVKYVMNNWLTAAEDLLKDPSFGEGFTKNFEMYQGELKKITAGAKTEVDIAKKIFEYVRENYTCSSHHGIFLTNTLRKVFMAKTGNVADINLLLTSMLINQGLDAHPVLLSTRDHGKAIDTYPVMDKYNYVISEVKIDSTVYLLDASDSRLGFNHLNQECYNGYARIIDKAPAAIDLNADKIRENKLTNVFVVNDEKGGMTGSFSSTLGDYESYKMREKLAKTSKEEYFKEVKKEYSYDLDLSNTELDSLKNYEEPVAVKYDFKFGTNNEDVIYFNPVFTEGYKENPFKSAERLYPVEMPYTINETFNLRMEIPKGYAVEEMPKSARVKLNEDEGLFEYMFSQDETSIGFRTTLKINKATFLPEDYQSLRDFFTYVVKKQSEQIVLKKIK